MAGKLTIQNAEIQTAAVEIKTLTVSGRQVTLAVFRQLREEPLIADDGALNGEPWGIVNYHPDKCAGSDHVHAVWQDEIDLLRSRVNITYDKTPIEIPEYEKLLERYALHVVEGERDRSDPLHQELHKVLTEHELRMTGHVTMRGLADYGVDVFLRAPIQKLAYMLGREIYREIIPSAICDGIRELVDGSARLDDLQGELCRALDAEDMRRQTILARSQLLREQLPQLFIAV
jgi:hypothetical protein